MKMSSKLLLFVAGLGEKPATTTAGNGLEVLAASEPEDFEVEASDFFTGPDGQQWERNALGIAHPRESIYTVKWSRMSERYDSSIRAECFCRPV